MERKHFYLTTPIYYVNDKPHLGHAYTTVAADVLARSKRKELGEKNVFFLTGTDEHGSKVAESAAKAGLTPKEFCDKNSLLFRELFAKLNISNDDFIRTTETRHKKAVEHFLNLLKEKDQIYEGTYEGLYCTACERFYTEKELVNGKCPFHFTVPERVKEKNYFFKLTNWLGEVKHRIEKDKIKIEPIQRKNETLGFFLPAGRQGKQGLEDFSISREKVTWGIPLPFDKKQVTYVWVDALINYLSGIGYPDKKYKKWWPADLHLIGRDILKFHAIYWPALLLAVGLEPPKRIFVHGFFTVNGQKMSKSLGNAIDPHTLIEQYAVDATRYLLLSQFPFGQDGDISEERLKQQFNADLANGLGNLVSRVATLVEQSGGVINAKSKNDNFSKKMHEGIAQLAFSDALGSIFNEVRRLDAWLAEQKPWELDPKDSKRIKLLGEAVSAIITVASDLAAFAPEVSKNIVSHFESKRISRISPLFPRRQ